ncbi:MAG: exodeoxyribonuclease I [Candidatus Saccharibacteria bacterium]|nr:exodeoxyribonuclease I [Candidatus Saccharibacteria bacterium]
MDPDKYYFDDIPDTTFFFYDLETSGLSPKSDRIMQFAGQRTSLDFHPIGDPINILVKLTDDTLPSPGAIMVTKITPQSTQLDGLTEAEFCRFVMDELFTPGTIAVGYNSVRFDDEFMRYTFWRNFYDPYEWQWRDGRSRWDLLDVVRLTRALRPEGITWPVSAKGTPTNRLELLTKENGIAHEHAHDALSDVEALISVTKLISEKQPKLYEYLFKMRDKSAVKSVVNLASPRPFVYASGRYPSSNMHTTVAYPLTEGRNGNVLVFDLRYNLEELLEAEKNFEPETRVDNDGNEYETAWRWSPYVKELAFNRCPAVSPLGVLDAESEEDSTDPVNPCPKGSTGWQKIGLTKEQIEKNLEILKSHPEFIKHLREANAKREERFKGLTEKYAEGALYEGFTGDADRAESIKVHEKTKASDFANCTPNFSDKRLKEIYPRYLARNFRSALSDSDLAEWEKYRVERLKSQEQFFVSELEKLQALAASGEPMKDGRAVDESILEDLMLWYQSLASSDYE